MRLPPLVPALACALAVSSDGATGIAANRCDDLAREPLASGASPPALEQGLALGLDGAAVDPLAEASAKVRAVVLVFVAPECPISNRYAPELARLAREWTPRGIRFWAVYPDASLEVDAIRDHIASHDLGLSPVRDPRHALVGKAGVEVTPEAAVFVGGTRVYSGRIDDRAPDFGTFRAVARDRTLESVIAAVASDSPVTPRRVPGVGCAIADLPQQR